VQHNDWLYLTYVISVKQVLSDEVVALFLTMGCGLQKDMKAHEPRVLCYGDSLTAGYDNGIYHPYAIRYAQCVCSVYIVMLVSICMCMHVYACMYACMYVCMCIM
jgi:hypothetical protein